MGEPEVRQAQTWMQRAILGGGAAPEQAERLIAGDERLSAAQRIAIYARGYRARLIESLRSEYPALRLFAGDTVFDLFAEGYIAACPSTRPSLYDFGAGFADYLEARQPPEASEPGSILALPAQLARLERARAESQRAIGIEAHRTPVAADTAFTPGARLLLPETVRLLRLAFDLEPLIAAADRGEPAPAPEAAETCLAVARSAWRVRVHRLEPMRFAFLEALGKNGIVEAAAVEAGRASGRPVGTVLAELALWLPAAGRLGLVAPA